MAHHDSTNVPVRPFGADPVVPAIPDGADQFPRADWLHRERQARQEAAAYQHQLAVMVDARRRLDFIWSAHPDWTFEQVVAEYLANQGEGAP